MKVREHTVIAVKLLRRSLLAVCAAICGLGAAAHAAAYHTTAVAALKPAHLPPFLLAELKVLWLADSATLAGLALVFGYLAARPHAATGCVTMLVGLIPAATAALLYDFLGRFYAADFLALAAGTAIAAGALEHFERASRRPAR